MIWLKGFATLKIALFLVFAVPLYAILPLLFWNLAPDWHFFKGASKGSLVAVFSLLLLSHYFLKIENKTLTEIGIEWKYKRLIQLILGIILGIAINTAISFSLSYFFRFEWHLNPDLNFGVILTGLFLNCWSAIAEELIYRGCAFKATIDKFGNTNAVVLFISIFAVIHIFAWGAWGDPVKMLSVFCTTGLGGLLFSIAFIKTKSIALPSGLHMGFIWANADFFTGMFARWYDNKQGLFIPINTAYYEHFSQNGWFIINLPYCLVLLITIFIFSSVLKEA